MLSSPLSAVVADAGWAARARPQAAPARRRLLAERRISGAPIVAARALEPELAGRERPRAGPFKRLHRGCEERASHARNARPTRGSRGAARRDSPARPVNSVVPEGAS